MFDDLNWQPASYNTDTNFNIWRSVVCNVLNNNPTKKLIILEMGCGIRVYIFKNFQYTRYLLYVKVLQR